MLSQTVLASDDVPGERTSVGPIENVRTVRFTTVSGSPIDPRRIRELTIVACEDVEDVTTEGLIQNMISN